MEIGPADAFLVIDPQNDFCEGGALAVQGGAGIMPLINRLADRFDRVVVTQDWHTPDQISFASNHPGAAPFTEIEVAYGRQMLWPDHCIQGSPGADFHPGVAPTIEKALAVIRKGYNPAVDSYSGFFENDHRTPTGLAGLLRDLGVTRVFLAGLAFDYCVRFTAEDAVRQGFETVVIADASRAIAPQTETAAREGFRALGVVEIEAAALLG
nr:bifunctional nicotinamidase/pyrazinamidase [uncultured Brevundimonas sp.]